MPSGSEHVRANLPLTSPTSAQQSTNAKLRFILSDAISFALSISSELAPPERPEAKIISGGLTHCNALIQIRQCGSTRSKTEPAYPLEAPRVPLIAALGRDQHPRLADGERYCSALVRLSALGGKMSTNPQMRFSLLDGRYVTGA